MSRVHFAGEGLPADGADTKPDESGDDDVPSDEADFSDDGSDVGSYDGQNSFTEEETKSRFTSYSMTSSVIRRNNGLTLVDDRFEKVRYLTTSLNRVLTKVLKGLEFFHF